MIELHDAFTISDVQTYEDVGIRPYGQGRDYVESGDCYHVNPKTGQPGRLPSNLSGGLIGCMHAVGATGIMQTFEIATHIWNRWAEIHGDPRSFGKSSAVKNRMTGPTCRSEDAKRAMAISHAGVGLPRDFHHSHGSGPSAQGRRLRAARRKHVYVRTSHRQGR